MSGARIETDDYVYFLYSEQQLKKRTEVEAKLNNKFHPGVVIINGKRLNFTEMSKSKTNRFPDVKIVAQGSKSKMKFVDVKVKKGGR